MNGPYGSDDPGRASRERHSREVHARLGRDARERMQRPDLLLTVAELKLWLHDQPGHATIRLNVRGQVAHCEGHTLGSLDNDEPVVVLTGQEAIESPQPPAALMYSTVAGTSVPPAQRARRDRLLTLLRHMPAGQTATATELESAMSAIGERAYNYDLCASDLRVLERYHLARYVGGPIKRWSAT